MLTVQVKMKEECKGIFVVTLELYGTLNTLYYTLYKVY